MPVCCFCWPEPTTAKEPGSRLPGLELQSSLFVLFLPSPHPFSRKERKVGLPVASIPQRVPFVDMLLMSPLSSI